MPRESANAKAKAPKRDPRLRPLHAPVDPWAWVVETPTRKVAVAPVQHNVDNKETKPSFYEMVKAALLDNNMHYLRGVKLNAIYTHVAANWPVDLDTYRRLTRLAIKRAIHLGKIEVVDGLNSYRLTQAGRGAAADNAHAKTSKSKRTAAKGKAAKRGTTKASKKNVRGDEDDDSDSDDDGVVRKAAPKKAANGRHQTGDFDTQQPGEGKWVWQYNHAGWHDYYPAASDEVEKTYHIYEKEKATGRVIDVRAVKSGSWEYAVDFHQFTQQNVQHEAHTVRSIRRIWRAM